jgi:hypothetical protein
MPDPFDGNLKRGVPASASTARITRRCTVASSLRRSFSAERRKLTACSGIELQATFDFRQEVEHSMELTRKLIKRAEKAGKVKDRSP